MKLFIYTLLLLMIAGCSNKNAFTQFEMTKEQELSVSNLLSDKIKSKDGNIKGVISAIYLNEIYPKSYNTHEYFFVYMFLKEKQNMSNPKEFDNLSLNLKLNGKTPLKIKQLKNENRFSNLAFIKSEWNRYYLVAFEKDENPIINLTLEGDGFSSNALVYNRDKI